jgi:hypothetical protein
MERGKDLYSLDDYRQYPTQSSETNATYKLPRPSGLGLWQLPEDRALAQEGIWNNFLLSAGLFPETHIHTTLNKNLYIFAFQLQYCIKLS